MNKDDIFNGLLSNTFLFTGFSSINYAVYEAQYGNGISRRGESALADRIKYVENGNGRDVVFTAAVAMAIDSGLMASLANDNENKNPELWVFGFEDDKSSIEDLDSKLGSYFLRKEGGKWSVAVNSFSSLTAQDRSNYNRIKKSLCDALKRVLERFLLRHGYLQLGSDFVFPLRDEPGSLLLSLEAFVDGKCEDTLGIRVSIKRGGFTVLAVEDVEMADGIDVLISPHGTKGTLRAKRPVGKHLAESIHKRWKEVGLMESASSSNEFENEDGEHDAVYVELADRVMAPFPRRLILIENAKSLVPDSQKRESDVSAATQQLLNVQSFRARETRKRPRSTMEEDDASKEIPESSLQPEKLEEALEEVKDAKELLDAISSQVSPGSAKETFETKPVKKVQEKPKYESADSRDGARSIQSLRLLTDWSKRRMHLIKKKVNFESESYIPVEVFRNFAKLENKDAAELKASTTSVETAAKEEVWKTLMESKTVPNTRSVKFQMETSIQEKSGDIASSIPIDCLSVSLVLRNMFSSGKVNSMSGVQQQITSSGETVDIESMRKEIVNILRLVDMQVVGRSELEDGILSISPPLSKGTGDLPLGTARRSLRYVGEIFKMACASRRAIPQKLESSSVDSSSYSVSGPLCINSTLCTVTAVEPPSLCVGLRGDWAETSSCILPFWEKAGLEPYSASKNVVYSVVAPSSLEKETKSFFRDLETSYQECSLGEHRGLRGSSFNFVEDCRRRCESCEGHEDLPLDEIAEKYRAEGEKCAAEMTAQHNRRCENYYVLYVVCPMNSMNAGLNGVLTRKLAALLSSSPDSGGELASSLIGGVRPLFIKFLPRELLRLPSNSSTDRNRWPFRSQLTKNYAFVVYNMLRSKRVFAQSPTPNSNLLNRKLSTYESEFWSPVTPEYAAGTIMSNASSATIPSNVVSEDVSGPGTNVPAAASFAAQEVPQTSFLFEPAAILAGVGGHLQKKNESGEITYHLCYEHNPSTRRYSFAWTDNHGEILDVASLPSANPNNRQARRVIFNLMWNRGRRWHLPFVHKIRVVCTKLGALLSYESDDWEMVIEKAVEAYVDTSDNATSSLIRKFPPAAAAPQPEVEATTPKMMPEPSKLPNHAPIVDKVDQEYVRALTSVSIVELEDEKSLQILPLPVQETSPSMRNRDLILSFSEGGSDDAEATAYIVRSPRTLTNSERNSILRVKLSRYFASKPASDSESAWDSNEPCTVVAEIARNLYELCIVLTPACWPPEAWQAKWPLHAHTVRAHSRMSEVALSAINGMLNKP